MGFDVKNTTKISILDLLCPYTCRGCGRMGELFCGCCKKNLNLPKIDVCPKCKCEKCGCKLPFSRCFVAGWREGVLKEMVTELKYQSVRGVGLVLGEIMAEAIPEGFGEGQKVIVVPLPTSTKHIRARGLDHTVMLAKTIAKKRGWRMEKVLLRAKNTVQVGADEKTRIKQAAQAYVAKGQMEAGTMYVLVDDVWTTGSSMMAAARTIKKAGAQKVTAVVAVMGK